MSVLPFLHEERDGNYWSWSPELNDFYMSQYNRDLGRQQRGAYLHDLLLIRTGALGQWEKIWNKDLESSKAPSGKISKSLPGEDFIVKAGMTYGQLGEFDKESLLAYVEGKKAQEELRQTAITSTSPRCQLESEGRIYHQLKNSQDIRVMELCPGTFNDVLTCILHVCSVEFEYQINPLYENYTYKTHTFHAVSHKNGQPVWYTAISYVWGNPAFIKPMICNGKPFFTTVNLDTALRSLRRVDVAVMLWVDQICINQVDLEEKTQQVLLMSRIFNHAWSTLIWLGEEADDCRGALKTILAVNDAFQCTFEDWIPEPEDLERIFLPAPGSPKWSELGKFLARPWFQRVWIIQEIAFSKNIQFLCGSNYISWEDMSLFALCMIQHDLIHYLSLNRPSQKTTSESGCRRLLDIFYIQSSFTSNRDSQSLLNTLVYGRGAQATDPRDKVFAVMGMTATIINPDYSKPTFDVYTEAAESVEPNDIVTMLCCVDHSQPVAGRPSWVPDWSTPRQTTALGYSSSSRAVYQNAKISKSWPRPIRQDGKSLVFIGTLFDTISNLTGVASSNLKDVPNTTTATSKFVTQSMVMATQQCSSYISSKTGLFFAFWQTLVAGKDESGRMKAPTDEFGRIFALLFDCATAQSPSIPDQPPPHPNPKKRLTLDKLNFRRPQKTYRQMQLAFSAAVTARRFATTKKGYMGLMPRGAMLGDSVCVIVGAQVPFLVRRVPHDESGTDRYQLLGECYLQGIMNGEVMASTPESEMREFELV